MRGFPVAFPRKSRQEPTMPKLKTNKAASKRLKLTKTGRIKRGSPGRRHMMKTKDAKRRRRMRKAKLVAKPEERRMRRLLGLGG